MKITRLSSENRYAFADMDPYMYLDGLGFPNVIALAVTNDDTAEKQGLMVCRKVDDAFLIAWMYVVPEHRNRGIGEKMVETAFEIAAAERCTYVAANILLSLDNVFRDPAPYFRDKSFVYSDKICISWIATLSDFTGHPLLKCNPVSPQYRSVAFSDMSGNALTESINYIADKIPDSFLLSPDSTLATAENDVSTLMLRDGKPCGILTLMCIKNDSHEFKGNMSIRVPAYSTLYTTLFSVLDKKCGVMLLADTLRRIIAKYPPNTIVRALSFNEDAFPIWEAVFTGAKRRQSEFMFADVKEYMQQKKLLDDVHKAP